jgi:hypothetical protein
MPYYSFRPTNTNSVLLPTDTSPASPSGYQFAPPLSHEELSKAITKALEPSLIVQFKNEVIVIEYSKEETIMDIKKKLEQKTKLEASNHLLFQQGM